MKRNKTAGPEEIIIEMLKAVDDLGTDKVIQVIKEIYDNGKILEGLSRSLFMVLSKKADANECKFN